jgi:hypothetical protein
MGHNDACTHTTSKTGNSCSGDSDPNNYCWATNAAFDARYPGAPVCTFNATGSTLTCR